MKYIYGFLLALILASCSNEETITRDQLQIRQGLFYKVNDQKPFTGFITSSYSNSQVKEYFSVKNGLYHGEYSTYSENGQLSSQGNFKNGNGEVIHYDQDNTARKINYYFENEIDPYEVIYVEESKYLNLKEPDCKILDFEYCSAPKSLTSYYLNSDYRKGICEGAIHRCNAYTRYIEDLPTSIVLNENTIDGWVMTIAGQIVHMTHLRGNTREQSYYQFDEEELVFTSERSMELIGDGLANFSYLSHRPDDFRFEQKGTISFEGDRVIINSLDDYNDDQLDNTKTTEIYYEKSNIALSIRNEIDSSWTCTVYGDKPSEDRIYNSTVEYPLDLLEPIEEKSNFSEFSSYLEEIGCLELLNEKEISSYYQKLYDDLEEERLQREKEEKARIQREKARIQREKEERRLAKEKEERRLVREKLEKAYDDKEYTPLVKIQPVYPRRAQEKGMEGYVIVAFTITEAGTIKEPYIIEAKCRSRSRITYADCSMFNSATLRAAEKLIYVPSIEGGRAVAVKDVQHKFTYEIRDP